MSMAEVPLASDRRLIACLPEHVRHRFFGRTQPIMRPRPYNRISQAIAYGMAAGHQPGSRWRAQRKRVKAVKAQPSFGQFVDVRSLKLAALISDVSPSKIVSKEHYDIWARCLR